MNCPNCGEKIPNEDIFCKNCGYKKDTVTESNSTIMESLKNKDENKKPLIICIISLITFFISTTFLSPMLLFVTVALFKNIPIVKRIFLSLIYFGLPIISLIMVIYCKIKYPKYTFAKVLIWIYSIIIALTIVILIFFMKTIVPGLEQLSRIG